MDEVCKMPAENSKNGELLKKRRVSFVSADGSPAGVCLTMKRVFFKNY
jgi:hypothetical protein